MSQPPQKLWSDLFPQNRRRSAQIATAAAPPQAPASSAQPAQPAQQSATPAQPAQQSATPAQPAQPVQQPANSPQPAPTPQPPHPPTNAAPSGQQAANVTVPPQALTSTTPLPQQHDGDHPTGQLQAFQDQALTASTDALLPSGRNDLQGLPQDDMMRETSLGPDRNRDEDESLGAATVVNRDQLSTDRRTISATRSLRSRTPTTFNPQDTGEDRPDPPPPFNGFVPRNHFLYAPPLPPPLGPSYAARYQLARLRPPNHASAAAHSSRPDTNYLLSMAGGSNLRSNRRRAISDPSSSSPEKSEHSAPGADGSPTREQGFPDPPDPTNLPNISNASNLQGRTGPRPPEPIDPEIITLGQKIRQVQSSVQTLCHGQDWLEARADQQHASLKAVRDDQDRFSERAGNQEESPRELRDNQTNLAALATQFAQMLTELRDNHNDFRRAQSTLRNRMGHYSHRLNHVETRGGEAQVSRRLGRIKDSIIAEIRGDDQARQGESDSDPANLRTIMENINNLETNQQALSLAVAAMQTDITTLVDMLGNQSPSRLSGLISTITY